MAEHDPARRAPEAPLMLRTGRDLPHSAQAEQGAILSEETAFDQVAPILKASDFYLLPHQHVYAVCEELARESKALDAITVTQRLDAKGLLGTAVPPDLAVSLSRAIGTTGNVVHYARSVLELSRLRKMMLVAGDVVSRGYEAGANVQAFLDTAQQEVFGAAAGVGIETLKEIKEPILKALDNLEAVQKRVMEGLSPITGVPTGIATLDKNTLGLQPGALCVLAA